MTPIKKPTIYPSGNQGEILSGTVCFPPGNTLVLGEDGEGEELKGLDLIVLRTTKQNHPLELS